MGLERAGQILDCTLRNARVLSPISVGMYVLHPTRPNGRVRKEFGTLTRRHRALRGRVRLHERVVQPSERNAAFATAHHKLDVDSPAVVQGRHPAGTAQATVNADASTSVDISERADGPSAG